MELLTALSSLTSRRARSLELADRSGLRIRTSPCASRRRRRHKLYGIHAWCGASGGAGRAAARILLVLTNPRTNKNAGLSDRALPALSRRPTDLCATALFSFQGTDASARPVSDRITDRTKGARRQSQRSIDYHRASTKSMASVGASPRLCPRFYPHRGSRRPQRFFGAAAYV